MRTKTYQLLTLAAVLTSVFCLNAQTPTPTFTSMNMASFGPIVATDSIVAGFGSNLAANTTPGTPPLTTSLGGVQVTIKDSSGATSQAPLYMVSSGQINYVIPSGTAIGRATVNVTSSSGTAASGVLLISNVAPALVTANANGKGVPAAQVLRVTASGTTTLTNTFQGAGGSYIPLTIDLKTSPTDRVYLMLYGTGIRHHSLNPVEATINGVSVPVLYAGVQSQYPGLDQVNIGPLPASLAGSGQVNLVLYVDGVPANTVTLNFL